MIDRFTIDVHTVRATNTFTARTAETDGFVHFSNGQVHLITYGQSLKAQFGMSAYGCCVFIWIVAENLDGASTSAHNAKLPHVYDIAFYRVFTIACKDQK